MVGWRNGRMAEWRNGIFTTYLIYPAIFMVHDNDVDYANDNTDDDANNTDGF